MKRHINQVKKFHEAFGIKNNTEPTNLEFDEVMLRLKLISEETDEYEKAALEGDLVEIADALGDSLYIIFGTILRHGMQDVIVKVFNEIQKSNMSKLDKDGKAIINGENGIMDSSKPVGKILKSDRFKEPDIKTILEDFAKTLEGNCSRCGKTFNEKDIELADSRPADKCVACFTSNA